MAIRTEKVIDANVYVNGSSTHGLVSEVTCPKIAAIMADYDALGMIGKKQFANGIDAMEATIKWKSPDNDTRVALANPFEPITLQVRSNKRIITGGGHVEDVPVVIHMRGLCTSYDGGTFTPKEDVEYETTFAIDRYVEIIEGEEIVSVDVLANVFRVDGRDIFADYRRNLGI